MELRNEQILCIGFPAWEGEYLKSTVQLVSELAKNNHVLYVEYPFTWKDTLMGRFGKAKTPWRRIMGQEPRLRKLQLENGAEVNVLTLPADVPCQLPQRRTALRCPDERQRPESVPQHPAGHEPTWVPSPGGRQCLQPVLGRFSCPPVQRESADLLLLR